METPHLQNEAKLAQSTAEILREENRTQMKLIVRGLASELAKIPKEGGWLGYWLSRWNQILDNLHLYWKRLNPKWKIGQDLRVFATTLYLLGCLELKEIEGFESDLFPFHRQNFPGSILSMPKNIRVHLLPESLTRSLELELVCLRFQLA